MEKKEEKSLAAAMSVLGFCLMLGLIIAALFVSSGIKSLRTGSSITVKGYAERDIVADLASWTGQVTLISPTLSDGFKLIKQQTDHAINYLVENGFKREEITLGMISQNENTEYLPNGGYKKAGYRFSQQLSIQDTNIDKIANIAEKSIELVLEGINFESFSPQYLYTKLDDLKIDMLGEATNDAKVRAEQIAKNGGNQIESIKSAQQGVFQITPRNSTDVFDYGMNDVSSKEKTIKSVVTVTYYLE